MRADRGAREPALPVGPLDLTCTRPRHFKTSRPELCGKPAVAKIPLHFTGQLTTIYLCAEDEAFVREQFPNGAQWIEPV